MKSKTDMHTYRCKDKHRHIQIHRDIRTDALTDRHRNTHIYLHVHIQKHVQSHTQADTVTHEQILAHTHMERYAHIRTRRRTYQYTLHFQSSRQMYRRMQTHKWTDIHRDTRAYRLKQTKRHAQTQTQEHTDRDTQHAQKYTHIETHRLRAKHIETQIHIRT